MSNGGFAYPDVDQAVRFHYELMRRLGKEVTEAPNEAKVKSTLDRAIQMAQTQRGDMVSLTAFLLYGLIRDKPFGPGSGQTGMALTMAFLLRNGAMLIASDDEVAGVALSIGRGEVFIGMLEPWLRESIRALPQESQE
jgi:prophage maintenance system killer protein